ncbi:MAG: cytochrome C biogenesis protein CcmH [Hyphomicrobium sp.]|nr:MAG: cytochrome C biogenesis protein CcmH [Hyphomicrobium sp.]PPC99820.1 MAG: cytochrome C biogenesis protein CcmH [Hyphomicrobium sp.]
MRILRIVLIGCALSWATCALAVHPSEILPDANKEERARALSAQLRCLVCQNQSIDDSDAPLARDLRVLVRERISAGDSDTAVMDYVVARYGDFVLLKPPFNVSTLALWLSPLLLLALGIWLARSVGRPKNAAEADTQLTQAERDKLDQLLRKDT